MISRIETFERLFRHGSERITVRALQALTNRQLEDIGVARYDIESFARQARRNRMSGPERSPGTWSKNLPGRFPWLAGLRSG